jgi:glutathione S-transferase
VKLYISEGSPYARIVRVVILEKGLERHVEIIAAQTRVANSPYYAINPSGRVPYLVRDDGAGLEDSALICAYLDHLDGQPRFDAPAGDAAWEFRRLEALARSFMDGLAVRIRELVRPPHERSPTVIRHETTRSERMTALWETQVSHPLMRGALNMPQIVLACALGLDVRNPELQWRANRPQLCAWFERIAARPSLMATVPPKRH